MSAPSIVGRLQAGFGLASAAIVAALALVLHVALTEALDREDGLVLQGQAAAILQELERQPGRAVELADHPEKAEWRLLAPGGAQLASSRGMARVPLLSWPPPGGPPAEVEAADGAPFSVLAVAKPDGRVLQLALDRRHEADLLRQWQLTAWLATLAAALLGVWLGRVIARRGLRPLVEVGAAAAAIGPSRLHTRLEAAGYPAELQGLVASLNGTLARLEAAFERLTDLGGDLAHELRTPLQTLRGGVEGMLLRGGDAGELREGLSDVLEELERLAAMVDQLLFLARADDPRTVVRRQTLVLRDELADTVAFFAATAEEHGAQLKVDCAADVRVELDRGLLQRALHNLVANALRHGPAAGCVRLQAGRDGDGVWLTVADEGPGLPAAVRTRLGERFVRADPSRARSSGGSGLGLAIVAGIQRLHGGRLGCTDAGMPQLWWPRSG